MQREIAYRAWHKENKIMCDVLLICFVNRYVDVLPEDQLEGGTQEEWKFDEIELMQYTGLLDKEGNKIFEGDIVSDEDGLSTVVFVYDGFRSYPDNGDCYLKIWGDETTVVGNVYENPELLNQQQ